MTVSPKKNIAASQDFKCSGIVAYECPISVSRERRFDESGYDIDHIIELSNGGSDTIENCQALCLSCHRVKTSRYLLKK